MAIYLCRKSLSEVSIAHIVPIFSMFQNILDVLSSIVQDKMDTYRLVVLAGCGEGGGPESKYPNQDWTGVGPLLCT